MPPEFDQLQHLKALFATKTAMNDSVENHDENQLMKKVDWAQVLTDIVQRYNLSLDSIADQLVVRRDVLDDIVLNNKCNLNITERMHLFTLYKMVGRKKQFSQTVEKTAEPANFEVV